MDEATKRAYIKAHLGKADDDLITARDKEATQIVEDAERFVFRLESYLRQVGAI